MTAATDVIADVIERRGDKTPENQAKLILTALETLGFVVMAPQDIEWGVCPGSIGGPPDEGGAHRVALNMCVYCLQFDPE